MPVLACVGALGLAPAVAQAASVQVAVQTATPEQGIPVTLAFSGSADAGSSDTLYADVRPTGGIGCQPTYQSDGSATNGASQNLVQGGEYEAPGSFSATDTYSPPNVGSYLVCTWLEHYDYNQDQNITDASGSVTFSARGPQVGQLAVSFPTAPMPNVTFQVAYTTQTDQQLTLDSIIKPAGGLPCASSYELEQQQNQTETELSGPDASQSDGVFGGPTTTTATTSEPYGPYVICTWIEGPNSAEVDASTATNVFVGTPPPPPQPTRPAPASAGLRLTHVTASRRHGVTVQGTTAGGLRGTITVSARCGRSEYVEYVTAARGRFQAHLRLPGRCRVYRSVRIAARWRGSSSFAGQTLSRAVTIRR